MNDITTHCPNCEYALQNSYSFCPHCGQKANLHKLSFHDIWHDAVHYFTHADKSIFGLVKNLVTMNGQVAREFVSGKRKKHFQPLNFLLIVAFIHVLVVSVMFNQSPPDAASAHPEISAIEDAAQRDEALHMYERQSKAIHFQGKYSNIVALVAVPLTALIFWLFYFRKPYTYVEHLVACMYLVGFTNLVYALIFIPLSRFFTNTQSAASLTIFSAFILFQIIYSSIYYYQFINIRSGVAAVRASVASTAAVVIWFSFSSLLVGIYIMMG